MEEKDRQKMWGEYHRLEQWLTHLGNRIRAEKKGYISIEPREMERLEEMAKRGNQRLELLRKRLGIAGAGLPWFQFYEIVKEDFTQFLPEKYRDHQVQIVSIKKGDRSVSALTLRKEGASELPALEIEKYTDQVSDGADAWSMLGRMAKDYQKLICPEKKHQMER